jgi:hypothetical protein
MASLYNSEYPPSEADGESISDGTLVAPSSSDSASTTTSSKKALQDDDWIISTMRTQFPPEHLEWLRYFERSPDVALQKSYRAGSVLPEVDKDAPKIRIGITFMAGGDKPAVTAAEMNKMSPGKPDQKTPEWRVFTAASLLKRFSVGDDLSINQTDASYTVVTNYREREKRERNRLTRRSRHLERADTVHSVTSNISSHPREEQETQDIIRRNIQDYTLTIDSDLVELLHGDIQPDHEFDITCTLVEIDLFSMRDLMTNYRTIVQSGQRFLAAKDILPILDTMINDVRRLCTRSPRLFRMSTRSLIAQSTHTRYGVDYGNYFVTLTTSEGIRKLVTKSTSYFLSLNESKIEQNEVRPKFLQMLVLLVSFLNNDDLKQITEILESTFHIPGDRGSLELLIMKVLPLASINPQVFLEALYNAYKPEERHEGGYGLRLQSGIWEGLQLDLGKKGYIVPVPIDDNTSSTESADELIADDLESMLLASENPTSPTSQRSRQATERSRSFLAPWPSDGVSSSTIFRYLQNDGKLRENGNSQQASVRAINEIPPLDISSDDRDNDLLAIFTNDVKYRVSPIDADDISAMRKGTYLLSCVDKKSGFASVNLEIEDEILNKPFLEATKKLNSIVEEIKSFFGGPNPGPRRKWGLAGRVPSAVFTPVEEPAEARRFWADIVTPGEGSFRECCAEAFKVRNRVVYHKDIIRGMNSSLKMLRAAIDRLKIEIAKYEVKKRSDEMSRLQHSEVTKLDEMVRNVELLMKDCEKKRENLQKITRLHPEDPIKKVLYPSSVNTSGDRPEWQIYQTQLSKDNLRLIVQSKKLTVETVSPGDGQIVKVTFAGSSLVVSVEPLTLGGVAKSTCEVRPKDIVLWVGYYLIVVEQATGAQGQRVVGYFRVRSQEAGKSGGGRKPNIQDFPKALSQLI